MVDKNFIKIFLGRSSLEGGPLARSDVKFGGWTAGSTRCQIAPEVVVAPGAAISRNVCSRNTQRLIYVSGATA
ncbi:centromere protein B dimerization domain [White spot syndrome virus]|uniref:Centromere protein B dimerization domain n=1 Tax=White spot syndrome virus TaxID=342409 RepID=A0A2R2XF45_9VIRU|nr:centromere protein B dimerization domain [White spot syndrome virus]